MIAPACLSCSCRPMCKAAPCCPRLTLRQNGAHQQQQPRVVGHGSAQEGAQNRRQPRNLWVLLRVVRKAHVYGVVLSCGRHGAGMHVLRCPAVKNLSANSEAGAALQHTAGCL